MTQFCTSPIRIALFAIGFAFALPAAMALSTLPPSPSQQLSGLAEQYIDATFENNPIVATWNGDVRYAGKFVNNLTPAYRTREREINQRSLDLVSQINVPLLTPAERLTHAVFVYRLKLRLEELQHDFHLLPFNQFYSMPLALLQFASTDGAQPFRTVADYEAFLQRLDGFPGWADAAIENLREGIARGVVQPKVLVMRMLPQLKSQVITDPERSGFYVPVKKFPAAFAEADRARLTAAYRKLVAEKITPAITRLHSFLEKDYLPKSRDTAGLSSVPGGEAMYAFRVRESTTTGMSAEEIHQIGLREVARIRGELDMVRKQVGFAGDLNAFLDSVPNNPKLTPFKTEAEVIEAFRGIQRRVEPQIDKLFSTKPRAALEIRPEPELTRATAAANYRIGAPDGSRPGVFYAPVRDPQTYATPKMTATFLHEGLPGHHFQGSLAQESSLPRFRRFARFTAYSEGWGLYAESLGKEMGLYDDPYPYLGRLLLEMHRAIRLVVDTGMHAKGWTRERAIAYSLKNEGGREQDAVQEVERYMAIPGQALAYKIGELKILELRRRAEAKLGTRFDVRAFHHELLRDGVLPLAVLETKINSWIDSR